MSEDTDRRLAVLEQQPTRPGGADGVFYDEEGRPYRVDPIHGTKTYRFTVRCCGRLRAVPAGYRCDACGVGKEA